MKLLTFIDQEKFVDLKISHTMLIKDTVLIGPTGFGNSLTHDLYKSSCPPLRNELAK